MTIEELARITGEQFSAVDQRFEKLEAGQVRLEAGFQRLENGLQKVLDVVLELPTKKAFEKLERKVDNIDERVTILEQKPAHA